ncbi:MAG: flagellar hook-associated protein FlgK [Myxococcaceae bacterium]|nr:flagellar hook-associated protein FlgK [Myxococcaceae bacterium]
MADLLALLSQAASSLGAHRGAAATASNNLSNANTPGYARQRAELEAVLPAERLAGAFIGRGVSLLTVSQSRDRFLEAQLPAALAQQSRSEAQTSALSSVSVLDPDAGAGLTAALGDFYASLRTLSQNPSDLGSREAAVASTRALTLAFQRTAGGLSSARSGIDAQLEGQTQQVNSLAASMADLNRRIAVERAAGGAPNDLLDARQKVQDQLSTLTGAVPVPDAQGNVSMALASGAALVSGTRSATLSTQPNAANRGHSSVRLTLADGTGPQTLATGALGGAMGGALDARDGALASAERDVDTLAFDLAGAINTVHRAGYGLDGVNGRDLLTVGATAEGAAANIQVDATALADARTLAAASSGTTLPGDADNLMSLIATESQLLSTGGDATASLSALITRFGSAASGAQAAFEHDGAVLSNLEAMRDSVSGVSIDEEMINLTKAQRGYEAVMKVMKTTDELLETLMSLK